MKEFLFDSVVFFYVLTSAAQQPGVVKVLVYTATNQFIGEVNFTYEDEMVRVVQQAVKHGPKRMAKLFELLQMHFEEDSCDMPNTGKKSQKALTLLA